MATGTPLLATSSRAPLIVTCAVEVAVVCLCIPSLLSAWHRMIINVPITACSFLGLYGAIRGRWRLVAPAAFCWLFYAALIVLALTGCCLALAYTNLLCNDTDCKGRGLLSAVLIMIISGLVAAACLTVPLAYVQTQLILTMRVAERRHREQDLSAEAEAWHVRSVFGRYPRDHHNCLLTGPAETEKHRQHSVPDLTPIQHRIDLSVQ